MITEGKVIEIYCFADDFCKFFSTQLEKYQLDAPKTTRKYYRRSTLSDAGMITILILFHLQGYSGSTTCRARTLAVLVDFFIRDFGVNLRGGKPCRFYVDIRQNMFNFVDDYLQKRRRRQ